MQFKVAWRGTCAMLCSVVTGCLDAPTADPSSAKDGPLIGVYRETSEASFCDVGCPPSRTTRYVFSDTGRFLKVDSVTDMINQTSTLEIDSLVGHFERSGNQVVFTDLISYPIRTYPIVDQADSVYTFQFLLPWRKGPTRFEILRLDGQAMVLKWTGRSPMISGPIKLDTTTAPDSVIWSGFRK